MLDQPFKLLPTQDVVLHCEGKPLLVRGYFESGALPRGARLAFTDCLVDALLPAHSVAPDKAADGSRGSAAWGQFGGAAGARVGLLRSALRLPCQVRHCCRVCGLFPAGAALLAACWATTRAGLRTQCLRGVQTVAAAPRLHEYADAQQQGAAFEADALRGACATAAASPHALVAIERAAVTIPPDDGATGGVPANPDEGVLYEVERGWLWCGDTWQQAAALRNLPAGTVTGGDVSCIAPPPAVVPPAGGGSSGDKLKWAIPLALLLSLGAPRQRHVLCVVPFAPSGPLSLEVKAGGEGRSGSACRDVRRSCGRLRDRTPPHLFRRARRHARLQHRRRRRRGLHPALRHVGRTAHVDGECGALALWQPAAQAAA